MQARMSLIGLIVGFGHVTVAILVFALSVPLWRGKVRMNRWYGVRIPKSFESDANWYALNRYGAKQIMVYSAGVLAVGVLTPFLPLEPDQWAFWLLVFAPVILAVFPTVQIFRYARRL